MTFLFRPIFPNGFQKSSPGILHKYICIIPFGDDYTLVFNFRVHVFGETFEDDLCSQGQGLIRENVMNSLTEINPCL
jgi:hypothetical protein